jgi:hypothetical protein
VAGFKTFSNGQVLSATEVNSFMMRQQVTVFADAAARDSAITSPSHGMFAFLNDTNNLFFFDGSVWRIF